jgi:hypothetical protein
MNIPTRVQDELRARLLPGECTADINRIFIHTEGSVRGTHTGTAAVAFDARAPARDLT